MKYIDVGTRVIPTEFILTENYYTVPKGTHYVISLREPGPDCVLEQKNGEVFAEGVIVSQHFITSAQLEPCPIEKFKKLKAFT